MEEVINQGSLFTEYSSSDGRAKALGSLLAEKFTFEGSSLAKDDEFPDFAPAVDRIGTRQRLAKVWQPRNRAPKLLAHLVMGNRSVQLIDGLMIALHCFLTTFINSRQVLARLTCCGRGPPPSPLTCCALCPPPPPPPTPTPTSAITSGATWGAAGWGAGDAAVIVQEPPPPP